MIGNSSSANPVNIDGSVSSPPPPLPPLTAAAPGVPSPIPKSVPSAVVVAVTVNVGGVPSVRVVVSWLKVPSSSGSSNIETTVAECLPQCCVSVFSSSL